MGGSAGDAVGAEGVGGGGGGWGERCCCCGGGDDAGVFEGYV